MEYSILDCCALYLFFYRNDLNEDVGDALIKSSKSTKLSKAVNTIEAGIKMQSEALD